MVTNRQVRILMKLIQKEMTIGLAAAKAGMDEKTAWKYRKLGNLPSEVKKNHTWQTRNDPFEPVWDNIKEKLEINPGLEAKTLFEDSQRHYPGRFSDGQLRTLQRKVKRWRAEEGPGKEVYFDQIHRPGQLCESDFSHMNSLEVTIQGQPFNHLIYHFVLTYSNWETGSICFSESFETLSQGLQDALWELGGVPLIHRTDRLTAASQKAGHPDEFTRSYQALLDHYSLKGQRIQAGKANENGDIEQRHYRYKKAIDQSLMLRGSRDFESRQDYKAFLKKIFSQLNCGRMERFQKELRELKPLPLRRLESCRRFPVRVRPSSTIRIYNNVYSVHSRLIGEKIEARLCPDHLEIWYGQKCTDKMPRLRGDGKHYINYRHIIDWLVRKPGAFENYRYRDELFPTSRFRMAYDYLKQHNALKASHEYLEILYMAARENESLVDDALRYLIDHGQAISKDLVETFIRSGQKVKNQLDIEIPGLDLSVYDESIFQEVGSCI